MKKKFFKCEQGSITLFVLLAMLFFLLIVFSLFAYTSNKRQSQSAQIDKIKQEYESSLDNINQIYNDTLAKDSSKFDPEKLEIGKAINTDNYGTRTSYNVKTHDCPAGIWRLFYQDENYTYLINDELTPVYQPNQINTNYPNGSHVSIVGQKLNKSIPQAFTEANDNDNIKAVAWLTDTSENGNWEEYKNEDAVFAIGSPTLELFVASYNNRSNKTYTMNLDYEDYGYYDPSSLNYLSQTENNGIYHTKGSSFWWLASPYRARRRFFI